MSSAASSRDELSFYLAVAGTVALFIGANLAMASRRTDFARTRAGVADHRCGFAGHREPVRLVGRGTLADLRALAAPADLRRRRSDPRQGRRLLRLLAPVRASGVGAAALARCGRRRLRGAWCTADEGRSASGRLARPSKLRYISPRSPPSSCSSSRGGFTWSSTCSSSASRRPTAAARSRVPATSTSTSGFRDSAYSLVCRSCSLSPALLRRSLPGQAPSVVPHFWCGAPAALLVGSIALLGTLIPALVQRYRRRPEPAAERAALSWNGRSRQRGRVSDSTRSTSSPTHPPVVSAPPTSRQRATGSRDVPIWDTSLLEARMRELVTDTPYYQPGNADTRRRA